MRVKTLAPIVLFVVLTLTSNALRNSLGSPCLPPLHGMTIL
jgi:hypothetical protein